MRPMSMTTLTTIISMVPNALAFGKAGAMMQGGLPVSATYLATSAVAGAGLVAWGMMYPNTKGKPKR